MKLVYSHWSLGGNPFKEMIACSNRLAQAHGYETILFTDKEGKENFKNIKFNDVRLFSDKINKLPKKAWSLGKLLAMSEMDEPFFHIDQDIFLYKNVLKNFLDKKFVCLHDEPDVHNYINFSKIVDYLGTIKPKSLQDPYEIHSHNFAIFGGTAFKEIKSITSEIIDICIEEKNKIQSFSNNARENSDMTVYFEQVWIPAMLVKQNIYPDFILNAKDLLNDAKKVGVTHFWTTAKDIHKETIIKYAKKLKVSY